MELTKLNQAERTFILRKGAGQLNVGAFNINNSIQLVKTAQKQRERERENNRQLHFVSKER